MDDETIEGRFALVDDRFEHQDRRIATLEQAREERVEAKASRHDRTISWVMLALFVVEVIIGIGQFVWATHHA